MPGTLNRRSQLQRPVIRADDSGTSRILGRLLIATLFVAGHVLAILWYSGHRVAAAWSSLAEAARELEGAQLAALGLPLFAILLFAATHFADRRFHLRGVADYPRSDKERRTWNYADSAISRLSIHAAIGIGVVAVLLDWQGQPGAVHAGGSRFVAWSAIVALSASTLLCLVSVLCYAQSNRWARRTGDLEEPIIRFNLLRKGTQLDQGSWYVFMIGLVWALAVAEPVLAIAANFGYGGLLFFYYFRRGQ